MGLATVNQGDHLIRALGFFDPSQDWTRSVWVYYPTQITTLGPYYTAWLMYDFSPQTWIDGAYGYFSLPADPLPNTFVQDYEATSSGAGPTFNQGPTTGGRWNYVSHRFKAATSTLDVLVNAVVVTSGAFAPGTPGTQATSSDVLGADGSVNDSPGVGFERARIWQAFLTTGEIALELASPTPVRTANLLANVDLVLNDTANLTDTTLNGRDFSLIGAVTYINGPFNPEPEWVSRIIDNNMNVGTVASGTVTLVMTVPTGTVDGELLVMDFTHQGAGFGVVPAGWTLIGQGLQGTTRVEKYYRIAATEPANYTVTGLGTAARGIIEAIAGVDRYNPLITSSVLASGAGTRSVTSAITVPSTEPFALLHAAMGSNAAEGTGQGFTTQDTVNGIYALDTFTQALHVRSETSASGIYLATMESVKVLPGVHQALWRVVSSNFSGDRVGIIAAFRPRRARTQTSTRYYLTAHNPKTTLFGPTQGTWAAGGWASPRSGIEQAWPSYLFEMSKTRAAGGYRLGRATNVNEELASSNQVDSDFLYQRWISAPLAAQTIAAGTFQSMLAWYVARVDTNANVWDGYQKVHIWLTDGEQLVRKQTILDNYVDSAQAIGGTFQFRNLNAAQATPSVTVAAGDRLVIEIGVHLFGGPDVFTHVPTHWAVLVAARGSMRGRSAALLPAPTGCSPTGLPDTQAALELFTYRYAPYFHFSSVIVPLADVVPDVPTNTTCATALVIGALPYTWNGDQKHVPVANRDLWWRWTAPFNGRVYFDTFKSTSQTEIKVFEQCGIETPQSADVKWDGSNAQIFTSIGFVEIVATIGKTYYIRVRQSGSFNAPAASGRLHLRMVQWQPLANNDLIYPIATGHILRHTKDGDFAEIKQPFSDGWTGVAIDYTKRPYPTGGTDPHVGLRLYLGDYVPAGPFSGSSNIVEVLDLDTYGFAEIDAGIGQVGGPMLKGGEGTAAVAINQNGQIAIGVFGNGFGFVSTNLLAYLDRVTDPTLPPHSVIAGPEAMAAAIVIGDDIFSINDSFDPAPPMGQVQTTLEAGGTNYVEYDDTGLFVYYTSASWYVPRGGQNVYRYNTVTQVSELFATIPATTTGPNPGVKGLFPLPTTEFTPTGGCLVCNGDHVVYLDRTGALVDRLYPISPAGEHQVGSLADVELDSTGRYFWVMDEMTSCLFKFDIVTRAQLFARPTYFGSGSSTSIVSVRLEAFPPAPPECPASIITALAESSPASAPVVPPIDPCIGAIQFLNQGDGLVRDAGYLDLTRDWTRTTWVWFPVEAEYYTAWLFEGAGDGDPFLGLFAIKDTLFRLNVEAYRAPTDTNAYWPISAAVWYHTAVRYTAAALRIDLLVDGVLVTSFTPVPLAGASLIGGTDRVGFDNTVTSLPGLGIAYDGVWQRALSDGEILAQRTRRTPVSTVDLLRFEDFNPIVS